MKKPLALFLIFLLAVSTLSGCKPGAESPSPSATNTATDTTAATTSESDAVPAGNAMDWSTPLSQVVANSESGIYEKFLSLKEGATLDEVTALLGVEPELNSKEKDYMDSYYYKRFPIDEEALLAQNLEHFVYRFPGYEIIEAAVGINGLYIKAYDFGTFSDDLVEATVDIPQTYQNLYVGATMEETFQTLGSITMSLTDDLRGPGFSYQAATYSDYPFGEKSSTSDSTYLTLNFLNNVLSRKSISYPNPDTENPQLTQEQLNSVQQEMTLAEVQTTLGQDGYMRSEWVSTKSDGFAYCFGQGENDLPQAVGHFQNGTLLTWELY